MPAKDGRVGFGVVGVNWGLGRCTAIQQTPEARLVAVCARTEKNASEAAGKLGAEYHTDYRDLLHRDDVDVIAIYPPNASPLDIALDAARAGKHIIATKPLEVTTERVDAILDACRAAGV